MNRATSNSMDKKRYFSTMLRESQIDYVKRKALALRITQASVIESAVALLQAQDMATNNYPSANQQPVAINLTTSDMDDFLQMPNLTTKAARKLIDR